MEQKTEQQTPPSPAKMAKHEDYDAFVTKFKPKKTTDDCYTPPAVYEAVKNWALEQYPSWQGRPIVRPFYPGGDFENFDYPADCVVIDNPPFSIYAKIVRWYCAHGIPFLLFAPGLTAAVFGADTTYIISGSSITYENGAVVNTNFVTNHPGEFRFFTAPELGEAIGKADRLSKKTQKLPAIKFSPHVITPAQLNKFSHHGIRIAARKDETVYIRKSGGRQLFGSGFLLNNAAAQRIDAVKRVYREENAITTPLSEEEKGIIESLNKKII